MGNQNSASNRQTSKGGGAKVEGAYLSEKYRLQLKDHDVKKKFSLLQSKADQSMQA